MAADLLGAGEGDDLRHRVFDESVTDLRDVGDHDVQQARGQPGLLEDLRDQAAAADRGVLVGLEHHALPSASAGATDLTDSRKGKLKGLMTPTTPTGSR